MVWLLLFSNTNIHSEQENRPVLRTLLFLGPNPEWEQVGAMEDISTQGYSHDTNSCKKELSIFQFQWISQPGPDQVCSGIEILTKNYKKKEKTLSEAAP